MAKKKVKIALVVAANGKWNAAGWGVEGGATETDFDDMMGASYAGLEEDTCQEYWVNVEIDLPEQIEVQGEVEKNEHSA